MFVLTEQPQSNILVIKTPVSFHPECLKISTDRENTGQERNSCSWIENFNLDCDFQLATQTNYAPSGKYFVKKYLKWETWSHIWRTQVSLMFETYDCNNSQAWWWQHHEGLWMKYLAKQNHFQIHQTHQRPVISLWKPGQIWLI